MLNEMVLVIVIETPNSSTSTISLSTSTELLSMGRLECKKCNTKSRKQGSVNSPLNLFKGAKRVEKVNPIDTERMHTTIYRTSFGA